MKEIHLITGGSRSGKSAYAQMLAEALPGPRAYVATCPVIDAETAERVKRHQEARGASAWETIEEPVDLAGAIGRAAAYRVILIDCLTLWINNLMYEAEQNGRLMGEAEIAEASQQLLNVSLKADKTVVLVTNEVGSGIVPENPMARRFRDLAGRCNQVMASRADGVVLVVCGIPMWVKGREHGQSVA